MEPTLPLIHSMPAEPQPAPCQNVARRPAARLRRHVLGYGGFRSGSGQIIRHRLLPIGAVALVVDPEVGPLVTGSRPRMTEEGPTGWGSGASVGFSPLGVPALFGVPARELAGQTVRLDELIGSRSVELAERMGAARGWEEQFAVLDELFSAWINQDESGLDPVVEAAWFRLQLPGRGGWPGQAWEAGGLPREGGGWSGEVGGLRREGGGWPGQVGGPEGAGGRRGREGWRDGGGQPRVGVVAAGLGVGRRRLERGFREHYGMSPGWLARVARFQRAIYLMGRGEPLAAVAAGSGYADQPHLTREVRELTGVTPAQLRAFVQYPTPAAA